MMRLSPKTRWNLSRILPFGITWAVVGAVFMLSDVLAVDGGEVPEGAIYPNFQLFVFAMVSTFIGGIVVGILEMVYGNHLFRKASLLMTILYKSLLYLVFFFVLVAVVYPIAARIELKSSFSDPAVWEKFWVFWGSSAFWSTVLQLGFSLLLSLLYASISENLGHSVLKNFFTGKYHTPKEEERIFMFLDMRSSTTMAETLGHIRYFDLLERYYDDLADAIIQNWGEVYQYVGDEIVITWTKKRGIVNNNCIDCFFDMKKALKAKRDSYEKAFGYVPEFKAGLHLGTVTTGEVGALKKEIVYTGDVLNTTARIQALCNETGKELLVSDGLMDALGLKQMAENQYLGYFDLKGKNIDIALYGLNSWPLSTELKGEI